MCSSVSAPMRSEFRRRSHTTPSSSSASRRCSSSAHLAMYWPTTSAANFEMRTSLTRNWRSMRSSTSYGSRLAGFEISSSTIWPVTSVGLLAALVACLAATAAHSLASAASSAWPWLRACRAYPTSDQSSDCGWTRVSYASTTCTASSSRDCWTRCTTSGVSSTEVLMPRSASSRQPPSTGEPSVMGSRGSTHCSSVS